MSRDVEAIVLWEDVVHQLFDITNRFPKNQRFVLTNRILDAALDIVEMLVDAQYTKRTEQGERLERVNGLFTKLRVLLRIANREDFLSTGRLGNIIEQIDNIAKMVYGWKTRSESV